MGSGDSELKPRQRIVEAARALVVNTGPALLSMRDVAQKAGVSVGTVTYHFDNKDDLLEEALNDYYELLDRYWEEVLNNADQSPLTAEGAEMIVRGLFRAARANRNLARLRIMLSMQTGEVPQRRVQQHLKRYASAMTAALPEYTETELTLRMNSVWLLLARYASMHAKEWTLLLQLRSEAEASAAIEAHVVDMSLRMMGFRA